MPRRCINTDGALPETLGKRNPDMPDVTARSRRPVEDRFWEKVDATGPCWEWTAALTHGYGQFTVSATCRVKAHRFSWETLVGPIPDGLEIDHLCRNRRCVNPDHLEPVTHKVNAQRGCAGNVNSVRRSSITHCKRGHDLAEAWVSSTGSRHCLKCHALQKRAARAAAKVA